MLWFLSMPKVTVQKTITSSPKEAFTKVSDMLSKNEDLKKLDPSYQCEFDESTLTGQAKGKLFTASLTIAPAQTGSTVEITVDLPFTLSLAKGMVQKTLEKKLNEVFS
jgi:hypothetical protein